jgi:cleavage and polyadenylation specificity factor subunit 6/7
MEISPQKFNEIIRRNRIISSSAIARAITNSENGEFSDAMETLITAIKLIKESKIANHESSNIIVRSLQDVLHIIEIKNYNSRKGNLKILNIQCSIIKIHFYFSRKVG